MHTTILLTSLSVSQWRLCDSYVEKYIQKKNCTHGNKIKFTYDDEAQAHAVMDVLLQNPSECHILAGSFLSYKL